LCWPGHVGPDSYFEDTDVAGSILRLEVTNVGGGCLGCFSNATWLSSCTRHACDSDARCGTSSLPSVSVHSSIAGSGQGIPCDITCISPLSKTTSLLLCRSLYSSALGALSVTAGSQTSRLFAFARSSSSPNPALLRADPVPSRFPTAGGVVTVFGRNLRGTELLVSNTFGTSVFPLLARHQHNASVSPFVALHVRYDHK
jgi:hypothetical protein